MDKREWEHHRNLEILARFPENYGIGLEDVDLIATEPRIYRKGRLVAEPDIILFGRDKHVTIVEYKACQRQKRAAEQLQSQKGYLSLCTGIETRGIDCFFVFKEENKSSYQVIHATDEWAKSVLG